MNSAPNHDDSLIEWMLSLTPAERLVGGVGQNAGNPMAAEEHRSTQIENNFLIGVHLR